MSEDFDRASYALGIRVEQLLTDSNENAAVIVKACCWVLAGLVLQASREGDTSIDEAIRVTTEQLIYCTARLATDGLQAPGRIQ